MKRSSRSVWATSVAVALTIILGAPAGAQGETLYETRFLDPAQDAIDWEFPPGVTEVAEDGYSAAFTPGAFTVTLEGTPQLWFNPNIADIPRDQAVESVIASNSGDELALFGVACRADLPSVGYLFLIGADGFYTIARYAGGKTKVFVRSKKSDYTDAFESIGVNAVRGECVGKKKVKLTLFVNDEKVVSVVDKSPPKKVGSKALIVNEATEGERATTEYAGFTVYAL